MRVCIHSQLGVLTSLIIITFYQTNDPNKEKSDTYLMFQGKAVTRNNGHKEICKELAE